MAVSEKQQSGQKLYQQLTSYVRELIQEGELSSGARLPTEIELARDHQVSRGTVRQAMTVLVNEGLLERVQGVGTFVRGLPLAPAHPATLVEKRVGLVLPFLREQHTVDIMVGAEQAVKARGYQISFAHTSEQSDQQARDMQRLRDDRVAGAIIFPLTDITYDATIWQLHAESVPFVLIDRYFPKLACDYVVSDNYGGGFRATEHLIIMGHTRIGFVFVTDPQMQTTSVRDRWRGYCAALASYGIPYDESLVINTIGQIDALEQVLRREQRPSAIFAIHDEVALQLIQAAQRCGLHIPQDLALIGFDDLSYAAHVSPALTTIRQPLVEMGTRAGNLLIDRIEGFAGSAQQIELLTTLIIRESCGARQRVRERLRDETSG